LNMADCLLLLFLSVKCVPVLFQYGEMTCRFSYSCSSKTRQQLPTDSTLEALFFAA